MFRETLLESGSVDRKRKRWPMAVAFTLEILAGTVLILLPLFSTGVITVSAHPPIVVPLGRPDVVQHTQHGPTSGGIHLMRTVVVPISLNCCNHLSRPVTELPDSDLPPSMEIGATNGVDHLLTDDRRVPPPVQPPPPRRPVRISELSEAQLLIKVNPIYPRIAIVIGTSGEVKLHAIIARDGHIESLSVISGHPVLASAALDAVRQWRYRPYYLNGEAVEVETFITVNFKKTND